MANVLFKLLTRAQFDALTPVAGTFYRVQETDNSESFYNGSNKLDRNDLDVAEFALATATAGVVTIKAIKEIDGAIAVGTDTTKDVVLAKVATTGAAEDVSIADAGGYLDATDVEGAIQELAEASAGGVASKTVYITETAGGSEAAYSKRYGVYQGATGSAASPVPAEKLVDIDIPKDMVVEEGSVVDVVFKASDSTLHEGTEEGPDVTEEIMGSATPTAANAGKYIKLVIANATSDTIWIAAKDLVDIYTAAQNAEEVQVAISNNNVISATIVNVNGTKVGYIYDGTTGAMTESVAAALTRLDGADTVTGSVANKIKTAVEALDADLDATGTAAHSGTFVVSGVTEVDGVLTAVDSVEVENAGAAAAVLGTSGDTSAQATVYGAKAYADEQISDALTWEVVS